MNDENLLSFGFEENCSLDHKTWVISNAGGVKIEFFQRTRTKQLKPKHHRLTTIARSLHRCFRLQEWYLVAAPERVHVVADSRVTLLALEKELSGSNEILFKFTEEWRQRRDTLLWSTTDSSSAARSNP